MVPEPVMVQYRTIPQIAKTKKAIGIENIFNEKIAEELPNHGFSPPMLTMVFHGDFLTLAVPVRIFRHGDVLCGPTNVEQVAWR